MPSAHILVDCAHHNKLGNVAANSGILVRLNSPHDEARNTVNAIERDLHMTPDNGNGDGNASPTETSQLLSILASEKLNSSIQTFMAMCVAILPSGLSFCLDPTFFFFFTVTFFYRELHLQIKLIELQDLLKNTQHEPRLKGPFPIAMYCSILTSL
ncbi:uncharacterized protein FOMMEDRAFT_162951 [Fomitiporia mediterranea MF3/22]|uniref:Uncharacterized protein n=1 Tax=Fomitiporia mediterranea (strain MF3/22) TaxID=694068 RepID=R7SFM8_FOMME|nr:uncharacterized protein FOMMEDRAFT_162951 [Fomitiporia mediterranea MF3/22]EJC97531.1 hypothetical protein FOMMEDRAFT_162951 [Fomitiporia mediterranea MF3/22]